MNTGMTTRSIFRRLIAFFRFLLYFFYALLSANYEVLRVILIKSNQELAPGFLSYSVSQLSRFEVLVLSHLITLTPGTTTVQISKDFKELTLHALDARAPDAVRQSIQQDLQAPLLRWTRP